MSLQALTRERSMCSNIFVPEDGGRDAFRVTESLCRSSHAQQRFEEVA